MVDPLLLCFLRMGYNGVAKLVNDNTLNDFPLFNDLFSFVMRYIFVGA